MGKPVIDLVGKTFGALAVIERAGSRPRGGVMWACRCACGATTVVDGANLRKGATKSCGCKQNAGQRATHGMAGTPTYVSWLNMRARCNDPTADQFAHYGGRGVTVCEAWRSFEGFFADMGERPAGTTLDRIDPNGNYEASNCRWASAVEQARNRRGALLVAHNGVSATLGAWSDQSGIPYKTLWQRYHVSGFRGDKLFSPVRQRRQA